jgi:hypothetical protein
MTKVAIDQDPVFYLSGALRHTDRRLQVSLSNIVTGAESLHVSPSTVIRPANTALRQSILELNYRGKRAECHRREKEGRSVEARYHVMVYFWLVV